MFNRMSVCDKKAASWGGFAWLILLLSIIRCSVNLNPLSARNAGWRSVLIVADGAVATVSQSDIIP